MRSCALLERTGTFADRRIRCQHNSGWDFNLNHNLQLKLGFFDFELPNQHIDCVSVVLVVYRR